MKRNRNLTLLASTFIFAACCHTHESSQHISTATSTTGLEDMSSFAPSVVIDMRYATENNFTGQKVYKAARCLLRHEVAERVRNVQTQLEKRGLGLKMLDCYRPPAAQRKFWELVPDERYVSNPAKGSRHTKGTAVDLTIVDSKGVELEMPSAFDDFSEKAHLDYTGSSVAAQANVKLLQDLMSAQGFEPLATEWWHYDLKGWREYSDIDIDL